MAVCGLCLDRIGNRSCVKADEFVLTSTFACVIALRSIIIDSFLLLDLLLVFSLQCLDAVGLATGRASGL